MILNAWINQENDYKVQENIFIDFTGHSHKDHKAMKKKSSASFCYHWRHDSYQIH